MKFLLILITYVPMYTLSYLNTQVPFNHLYSIIPQSIIILEINALSY